MRQATQSQAEAVDAAIWNLCGAGGKERDYLRAIHSLNGISLLQAWLDSGAKPSVRTGRITSIWVDKHPQAFDPCCARASTEIADLAILIRRFNPITKYRSVRMWLLQAKLAKGKQTFAGASSRKQTQLFECSTGAPTALEVWSGNAVKPTGDYLGTFDLNARFAKDHLPMGTSRDPYFWSYLLIDKHLPKTGSPIRHRWPALPQAGAAEHGFSWGLLQMSSQVRWKGKAFGARWRGPDDEWERLGRSLLRHAQSRGVSELPRGPWVLDAGFASFLASPIAYSDGKDQFSVCSTGFVKGSGAGKRWQHFDVAIRRWGAPVERFRRSLGATSFLIVDQLLGE